MQYVGSQWTESKTRMHANTFNKIVIKNVTLHMICGSGSQVCLVSNWGVEQISLLDINTDWEFRGWNPWSLSPRLFFSPYLCVTFTSPTHFIDIGTDVHTTHVHTHTNIQTHVGSSSRAVEHRTVNREDGGSIPPTDVSKLRQFLHPTCACVFWKRH